MRKFENKIQESKYEVLREVSKAAFEGTLDKELIHIPKRIDLEPKIRCCIHKERVVTYERIKVALGGNKENNNIIEVIDEACDECFDTRYVITEACRGCLANHCVSYCPVGAIEFVQHKAKIDGQKCIECGKCKDACPYNAIVDVMRPCKKACGVNAINIEVNKKATIDNDKCIQCGACVYQCPFGAIMDKSYITEVIELLKNADENNKVYAIIAPAIASQFTYASIGQVITGIKKLGFHDVIEVALGADMVAVKETHEYAQTIENKKTITSSCCPSFVQYILNEYPELKDNISSMISPMIAISKLIKDLDPKSKVVFIGPCTAKKMEIQQKDLQGITDYALTFEELAAMIDSKGLELQDQEESLLDNASYYGRIFARTGGISQAIENIIKEEKLDVPFDPVSCDGIIECDKVLKKLKHNRCDNTFIEGMACKNGCIGGATSLSHGPKNKKEVDKYAKLALEPDSNSSLRVFDIESIDFHREF
ncbi:4Fe-4S dicluster domain-containing protein [Natranaerobius thermophilus]|uniref:Hydrogenase large subunit domain protein n=1 Tax=Natranaerobius thermophilus (strain ATCC BAA-1301 / DSM 18059 / JW/NM-WN-LF) TaxID=457570 RepID=B2A7U0_NATTJ|nr:4Fe-4S dicluster domain-containing protein [Natranaerobius thermophilus]ACB84421.1 hydrogenase large subunit domain protein [Natranaerobius thermophilus JW/NM-WN-LF]